MIDNPDDFLAYLLIAALVALMGAAGFVLVHFIVKFW